MKDYIAYVTPDEFEDGEEDLTLSEKEKVNKIKKIDEEVESNFPFYELEIFKRHPRSKKEGMVKRVRQLIKRRNLLAHSCSIPRRDENVLK